MKFKADVLVVGGGPAGLVAAITSKNNYPAKKIILIRKEEKAVIPCGIPYIFNRLSSVDKNIMSDQPLLDKNIDLVIGEVTNINADKKEIILENGDEYGYEKLILALGSEPQAVSIPGVEKAGVWLVKKDYAYLKKFRAAVLQAKNVVIVGGGFIGVEFAEELSRIESLNVSIVEKTEHCLSTNFDAEFSEAAEEKLKSQGVNIFVNESIEEIGGKEKVEYVQLTGGNKLPADLVILSIGAQPNFALAAEAGIEVKEKGGVMVDEYLKTNLVDVFAVGDCVQSKDFITNKNISVMLASVATNEARMVANNLYQIELIRENKGTLGAFATIINGLALGVTGFTEKRAKEQGFDYIVGEAEAMNRHPAGLPGAEKIKVKLIFSKSSESLLLGGEIMGSESIGEIINILTMAIQKKVSIFDFNTWQIASHPLLTASPTVYPLIAAAQSALIKLNHQGK